MKILLLSLVLCFALSCSSPQENLPKTNIYKNNNPKSWKKIFNDNNVNGTFVLHDLQSKELKYYNELRSDSSYSPASTFKILNSLIGLESKALAGENEIIKWDGRVRDWDLWNKDHSMKTAIPVSCVWFYQELARRIGEEYMQKSVDAVGYGNQNISGGVDLFWLQGDLKISAKEQVLFLERLIKNELPFQARNQEIVKKIMITDSTSNYIVRSKTGWGVKFDPGIGWFVGYVERESKQWIFAINIDIPSRDYLKFRKNIVYDILRVENIIE